MYNIIFLILLLCSSQNSFPITIKTYPDLSTTSIFLRYISSSELYYSNHNEHFLYNYQTSSTSSTYDANKVSPNSASSFYPLLFKDSSNAIFLIYYSSNILYINQLTYPSSSNQLSLRSSYSNLIQIDKLTDDSIISILTDTYDNYIIYHIRISDQSIQHSFEDSAKLISIIILSSSNYILLCKLRYKTINDITSWYEFYLYNAQLTKLSGNTPNLSLSSFAYGISSQVTQSNMKMIELSNNIIIYCYITTSFELYCLTVTYSIDSSNVLSIAEPNGHEPKLILTCNNGQSDFFSLYKLNEELGIIGCNSAPLQIQIINSSLSNAYDKTTLVDNTGYIYFDFISLYDGTFLYAGVKQSASQTEIILNKPSIDKCPNNKSQQTLYYFTNTEYSIGDLFLSAETEIKVKEFPSFDIQSGSVAITNGNTYTVSTLTAMPLTHSMTSFAFAVVRTEGSITTTVAECSISIIVCDEACLVCDIERTAQTCSSCNNDKGYYHKYNDTSNECFNSPEGYYLDISNKVYKKCDDSCKLCSSDITTGEVTCDECKDATYIKIFDIADICWLSSETHDGYVIKNNQFYPCYPSCLSCTADDADDSSHHCTKCNDGYRQSATVSTNCDAIPLDEYFTCTNFDTKIYSGANVDVGISITNYTNLVPDYDIMFRATNIKGNLRNTLTSQNIQINSLTYHDIKLIYLSITNTTGYTDIIEYYMTKNSTIYSSTCTITIRVCAYGCDCDDSTYCLGCKDYLFTMITPSSLICAEECAEGYNYFTLVPRQCYLTCPEGEQCYQMHPFSVYDDYTLFTKRHLSDFIKNVDVFELMEMNKNVKGDNYAIQGYHVESPPIEQMYISTLELRECKQILYESSKSDSFFIYKVDYEQEGLITNKVRYDIYTNEGTNIDISICNNISIGISYPIRNGSGVDLEVAKELYESGVDIFNIRDPFFSDICIPYIDERGNDVLLKDRVSNIYKYVQFCQEGCVYVKVNYTTMKVECDCVIGDTTMYNNTAMMMKNSSAILMTINIEFVKCTNIFFNSKYIMNNLGFWFIAVLILIQIALIGMLMCYSYRRLLSKLNGSCPTNRNDRSDKMLLNEKGDSTKRNETMVEILKKEPPMIFKEFAFKTMSIFNEAELQFTFDFISHKSYVDNLPYSLAIINDTRTFFVILWTYLKESNLCCRIFLSKTGYELPPVNASVFVFYFSLIFSFNVILFNEEMISYKYSGGLSMLDLLPNAFIAYVIVAIVMKLSGLTKHIAMYETIAKEVSDKKEKEKIIKRYICIEKIKISIMFIVEILVMIVEWYYVSTFCGIYHGSQMMWFISGWFSFAINIVMSILLCAFVAVVRYRSVHKRNRKMYNCALFLKQFLIG